MEAYAGHDIDENKLKESASGGAVSAISEEFIRSGGIVFGVSYSEDLYSAVYQCVDSVEMLHKFKSSKYMYVNKNLEKESRTITVYEDVIEKLSKGKLILFIGLGCDIAALECYAEKRRVETDKLFTVELLCDGVTSELVHKEYVSELEKIYDSKIIAFNVRYKEDIWSAPYIYAKFENGQEHKQPFYGSDYGFAFANYKKRACYNCRFKNENHLGDIIAGDYWGCHPGMKEYSAQGVSLLLVRSAKGNILLNYLRNENFLVSKIDLQYALYNNPRYFTAHESFPQWCVFDCILKEKGLREAVKVCSGITISERLANSQDKEVVLWGAGKCFRQYIFILKKIFPSIYVVDSDETKWGKELEFGITCMPPDTLKEKEDVLVLIMIENTSLAFQVVNKLLDLGVRKFDYIKNWIFYRTI